MIYSHVGTFDLFLILGFMNTNFLCLNLSALHSSFFYSKLIPPSSLNQISPTPQVSPPSLLSSSSKVFEINNHPGVRTK